MNRKVLIPIIISVAALSFTACQTANDASDSSQNDNWYLAKKVNYGFDGQETREVEYDEAGNITTLITYTDVDYDVVEHTAEYDDYGNKIKENFQGDGLPTCSFEYVYGSNGNKLYKQEIFYDSKGNPTGYYEQVNTQPDYIELEHINNGEMDYWTQIYIGDDGAPKSRVTRWPDGKIWTEEEFYAKGEVSKKTEYLTNSNNSSVTEYDEKGRVIKETEYTPGGAKYKWAVYEYYDDEGKAYSMSNYQGITEKYDSEGRTISHEEVDSNGTVVLNEIYQYEEASGELMYDEIT